MDMACEANLDFPRIVLINSKRDVCVNEVRRHSLDKLVDISEM